MEEDEQPPIVEEEEEETVDEERKGREASVDSVMSLSDIKKRKRRGRK